MALTYDNASGVQTLYLDGSQLGQITAAVTANTWAYDYVGAGFLGGAWTDQAWPGQGPHAAYCGCTISDVAFYRGALDSGSVRSQYQASKTSNSLITNGGATPVEKVNVTDPGGKTITYAYDATMGNRLLSRTDGLGNTTQYGYDISGFLNTTTDPDGNVVTTGHDPRGNLVSRTTCQNQATHACSTTYHTYYPNDTATTPSADPRNDVMLSTSDARSTGPDDATYRTTYTYDNKGNRLSATTPAVSGFPSGRTTRTAYTDGTQQAADTGTAPLGLPWKVTTAGGAVTTTTFFHNGDIATVTDPDGLVTSYTYDNLGRPTSKKVVSDTFPLGLTTTTTLDKLNRLTSQTDPAVTDRITGAVHTKKTTTAYDADGNVTSNTVADLTGGDTSRTTSSTFNSHDQQITSTDPANNTTTFGYDAYGNKNKVVDAAGSETDYAFDANGHLLTTTLKSWTGDPVNPSSPTDLVRESRAYDPAGRLASVTDSMGWVTSYTYTDDGLTATVTRSDPAHPGTSYVTESDSYDAAGNITTRVTNNGALTTNVTVDAANRVTDSLQDPHIFNRETSYTYTPDDQIASTRHHNVDTGSSTVEATYDLTGHTTSQTVDNDGTGNSNGWWKLNETAGTLAKDSSGHQHDGTVNGGVTWSGGAPTFNGSSGAIQTDSWVLDTTSDFTISVWVKLATLTGPRTAVGQDAGQNDGFDFGYDNGSGKWAFARATSDIYHANWVQATSNAAPALNTWTHLVAQYKVSNGLMTLYVNGVAQTATATDTTPIWSGNGMTIGRGRWDGSSNGYFSGSIANVQAYQRDLTPAEISGLYSAGQAGNALAVSRLTTTWTLDKRGLPLASTWSGTTRSASRWRPPTRTVTWSPPATTRTGVRCR
ncbi:MAG: hypothetical protein AUI14_07565 [Actinobacteria bacterium 13_2_20CM_2_71_6]|nr:MAG: hypothetical protein AUI14_07565 [Actinobacteria bacterium 13_2_20CM_2_71_6]